MTQHAAAGDGSDPQWRRVEGLFKDALRQEPRNRPEFLDRACRDDAALRREVESLLAADVEAGDFMEAAVRSEAVLVQAGAESKLAGSRIGSYRVIRSLGSGGMSTVYLAVRADDQFRLLVGGTAFAGSRASPDGPDGPRPQGHLALSGRQVRAPPPGCRGRGLAGVRRGAGERLAGRLASAAGRRRARTGRGREEDRRTDHRLRREPLPGGRPESAGRRARPARPGRREDRFAARRPSRGPGPLQDLDRPQLPGAGFLRGGRLGARRSLAGLARPAARPGPGGRSQRARDRALRALHGESHADTFKTLQNLGTVLRDKGEAEAAEATLRRALGIGRDVLGETHPIVLSTHSNLIRLLYDRHDYPAAEAGYRHLLSVRERQLGDAHPDVARSLNNLAKVLYLQGKHAEALPLYERALALKREHLGEDHPSVALSLHGLAMVLHETGRVAEAEPKVRRAVELGRRHLPAGHPKLAELLLGLGRVIRTREGAARAEPILREAVEILRASPAAQAWQVAEAESAWERCRASPSLAR